jgi:hypothetical protein
MKVCILLAALCLVRIEGQLSTSSLYRSSDFKFNIYVGNYKDCKVYIANIVVFDCGLQYSAYQWRYLFRNAGVDFPTGLKVNKDNNIIYKLKRLIDPLASDGEGDFYILK